MTLDPQISARLKITLSVRTPSGVDARGSLTYGSTRTMLCRVVEADDVIDGVDGQRINTTHEILTETEVLPSDEIKWGAYDWRKVQALQVGADLRTGEGNLWRLKV